MTGGSGGPTGGSSGTAPASGPGGGAFVEGGAPSGFGGGLPPGGSSGTGTTPPQGTVPNRTGGTLPGGGLPSRTGSSQSQAGVSGGAGTGGGGLLNSSTPSRALTAVLEKDAGDYGWVAATVGANDAAGYQLATGDPVMAIGGFNGTDPWPTLAAFEKLVSEHRIHYFIAAGSGGGTGVGGSAESTAITSWVESHFSTTTVGGTTLYDLTRPVTSSPS